MVRMDDNSLMPFGKYKGYKLANVPGSHLLWLYENVSLYPNLKAYIEENKSALEAESKRAARQRNK